MRSWAKAAAGLNAVGLLGVLGLALAAPPFQILTTHLPVPHAGQAYHAQLRAEGGTPPYHWEIAQGALPEGLRLDAGSGEIAGTPGSDAPFSVLVRVSDASTPPLEETRLLPSSAAAPLDIEWTEPPSVDGQRITGAVKVSNQSGQNVELTVIAVAVNEVGKAFSLRYVHQGLEARQSTGALPFAVFLPPGSYTIHVDAVAEVSADIIYRQRLEVPGLTIPSS